MKKLSMTLSSQSVALTDGEGTITASVTNASAAPERVVLGAFPAGAPNSLPGSTGATIEEPLRTIDPGATVQYEVAFDTAGAAPGTYRVKLIPYSADEAPEDYAELGFTVQLVVPEVVPVVEKRKFPWWIVAVVAAVLIIGGGVTAFLLTRSPDVELSLTSFSPSQGTTDGQTTVTLTGQFGESTVVTVGETSVSTTPVSDTEVTFITPPAAQAGQVPVIVESGGDQIGVAIFEYVDPRPTDGGVFPGTFCTVNPDACVFFEQNQFVRDFDTGEIVPNLDGIDLDGFDLNR